jgi:hypothetical protein
MLARAVLTLHRALVLVVLTVALTATGFAHRMPDAADGALAFALANGADASDFCGGVPGSDRAAAPHCPACQITASADLPQPSGALIDAELALPAQVTAPRQTLARRSIRDPAHGPQGPPVV